MPTQTESVHAGEFLISEANRYLSHDEVVLITGQNLVAGSVLGKITASGKYKIYDNTAADGSEVAAAILYDNVDATAADVVCAIINRAAEVDEDLLNWAANDSTGKAAGRVDLAAAGVMIKVR